MLTLMLLALTLRSEMYPALRVDMTDEQVNEYCQYDAATTVGWYACWMASGRLP